MLALIAYTQYVDILTLVVQILTAVLISSMITPYIPKVSLPLVQILLGVGWYFIPGLPHVTTDSTLFMVLFIAPLLYLEARQANRPQLASVLSIALSLAVGLVLLTMVASGVILHAIWPLLLLPAGIALGATLGPTDAVAVSSLSKESQLTARQSAVLKSECLLNDAASIVGFQFALLALRGYDFSLASFSLQIVLNFIGGLAIGVAIGSIFNAFIMFLRHRNLETTSQRILMELFLPLLAYVVAEHCEVSGVLAVVAAGLSITFHRKGVGSDVARINLVSNSVWEFIEFTLNGAIFVLLGIQLPSSMWESIVSPYISTSLLVVCVIVLMLVMLGLRFTWIAIMLRTTRDLVTKKRRHMTPQRWRSTLIMTFGGPKGAISLSLASTIPPSIDGLMGGLPIRNALLFITSGCIIFSLILANIMLPMLAPRSDSGEVGVQSVTLAMLRRTLQKLPQLQTDNNHVALRLLTRSYAQRIHRLNNGNSNDNANNVNALRLIMLQHEHLWIQEQIDSIDDPFVSALLRLQLRRIHIICRYVTLVEKRNLERQSHQRIVTFLQLGWYHVRLLTTRLVIPIIQFVIRQYPEKRALFCHYQIEKCQRAIQFLTQEKSEKTFSQWIITELILEYRSLIAIASAQTNNIISSSMQVDEQLQDLRSQALELEYETIAEMARNEEITMEQAHIMRINVSVMNLDNEF